MTADVHDFYGPYQIHTAHDGHTIVFIKGICEAFDMDSDRLSEIVKGKIKELNTELLKWNALKTAMGKEDA